MLKTSKQILFLLIILFLFSSCRDSINEPNDGGNGLAEPPPFGPRLTIIAPLAGETWQPGTRHEILWEVQPTDLTVDILLYRKTEFKEIIAEGIINSGSYSWRIPSGIDQSHHYRIHIKYSENPYQHVYTSDEFYVIH